MNTFYILIPVHNRCETTLHCLRNLICVDSINPNSIAVIDDGSIDGTAELIHNTFPGVSILSGDGTLWWGGAIRLGMDWAANQPNFAGVIWLNDDCRPAPGLIRQLIEYSLKRGAIASGQSFPIDGYVYGGHIKTPMGLKPVKVEDNQIASVDACNGNCVAIPKNVILKVGSVSHLDFPQNFGDADYTLRASQMEIPVVIIGGLRYENDRNINITHARWSNRSIPAADIISSVFSPRSLLYPSARWTFFLRHWGFFGIVPFIAPYVRLILTLLFRSFR